MTRHDHLHRRSDAPVAENPSGWSHAPGRRHLGPSPATRLYAGAPASGIAGTIAAVMVSVQRLRLGSGWSSLEAQVDGLAHFVIQMA